MAEPVLRAGNSETVWITLSAPAPASGTVVDLQISAPGKVSYPAQLTIEPGSTEGSFLLQSQTSSNMGDVVVQVTVSGVSANVTYPYICTNPLRIHSNGSGSLALYWDPMPGATGYTIYRVAPSGQTIPLTPTPINPYNPVPESNGGFRYVVSGLSNGVPVSYRVAPAGSATPRSNIAVGTPGSGTIRYASGTPSDIVADADALFGTATQGEFPSGGDITVIGPNGETYEGFSDGRPAIQSPARVRRTSTSYEAEVEGSVSPSWPERGVYGPVKYEGRLLRKIESSFGNWGLMSLIRPPSSVNLIGGPVGGTYKSNSFNQYSGGFINGVKLSEVDGGLFRNRNSISGNLNPHYNLLGLAIGADGKSIIGTSRIRIQPNVAEPDGLLFFAAAAASNVEAAEILIGFKGRCIDPSAANAVRSFAKLSVPAPAWTSANLSQMSIKQVTSIAQVNRGATNPVPAQGYYVNGDFALGAAWGVPESLQGLTEVFEYVTLLPSGNWDVALTRAEGKFPMNNRVGYVTNNAFFWERAINLDAR